MASTSLSHSDRRDVYALVTDRIIELLEQGTVPWRKPWAETAPQNLVSRKAYRGVNPFLLACTGHSSPFWLTFRQARQLGGHVKRGAKSTPVVFWKIFERQTEDDEGNEVTARLPVLRYYRVFNLEQCEGIPSAKVPDVRPRDFEPIQAAEAIVAGMPDPPKIERGAVDARYTSAADTVSVPHPGHFDPPESFYNCLYHELAHSTGHRSRLHRDLGDKVPRFGSADYSQEELVAEMGAAFLCGHSGISQPVIEASASYLQGWLHRLKNDRKLVVVAAAQAQKAADYILNVS